MTISPRQQQLWKLIEQKTFELIEKGHKMIIPFETDGSIRIGSIDPDGKPAVTDIGGRRPEPQIGLAEIIAISKSVLRSIKNLDRATAIPPVPESIDNRGIIGPNKDSALPYLPGRTHLEVA